MHYPFTPQQKILAEALAFLIIGLINAYGGIIFTLIMMGIHLHHERQQQKHLP